MAKNPTDFLSRLHPDQALRPGTFDARALLFIWCLRKTFLPLIWIGLIVAIVRYGNIDAFSDELQTLDDPASAIANLLSPLGVLVLAVGIRLFANIAGLAAAFPLTGWTRVHEYRMGVRFSRWFRSWWDRLYLARAYRSLRWTGVIREHAHSRLGTEGRFFRLCELIISWSNVVLVPALLVVIGATAQPPA